MVTRRRPITYNDLVLYDDETGAIIGFQNGQAGKPALVAGAGVAVGGGTPITIAAQGTPVVGVTLRATIADGWRNAGGNWTRDGANVPGATALDYVTAAAGAHTYASSNIPFTPTAIAIAAAASGGPVPTLESMRTMIRAGGVTAAAPLVPIGDSHTDNTTSAQYLWSDLKTSYNQPGEGLEGIPAAGIVPMGNNGQTLSSYLAGNGTNSFTAAMALNPSVVLACWLTNDVRQGALGVTVSDITTNGAGLLQTFISNVKAARPNAIIVLRVPAPYLTVNTSGFNYITDAQGNVNPAGLAQTYTTGVRQACLAAAAANPGVLVYDPQQRIWGTTSPAATGTDFADQIHQNQNGYYVEARDFAAWLDAAVPYSQALADAALASNAFQPWTVYNRVVEDANRFVKVADAFAVGITSGNTYADFGPSTPNALPTAINRFDILAPTASGVSLMLPSNASIAASGANTRISTIPALAASAAAKTRVRVYRQTRSGDAALNAALDAARSGGGFFRTGRVQGGSAAYLDISAYSLEAAVPSETASVWTLQAGDRVFVEGRNGAPITLAANFAASGNSMRISGLAGFDYSTLAGRIVVVVR